MIKGIGTHIKVANFKKSSGFYEALGFKKVFEYGPDKDVKENYNGVVYEHGNCKLELGEHHIAIKPEVFKEKVLSSKISLMIYVDKVSKILEKAAKNSIEIAVKPRHYYWGTIEVVIKDPDGTVLVFICDYSEDEAGKVGTDESWSKPKT